MSAQLLLVGNPAKRRARRKSSKAPSPAQKRARAKFAAMARARAGKRRVHAKRRTRRTAVSTVLRSNPVKRRRHVAKRAHAARRRTRRNPVSSASLRNITALLKTSATGAAGALGVDVLMGFVQGYLPAAISTPNDAAGGINYGYYAAKGALAVATGMAASKLIGASKAARIVEGSMTVTLHGLMARVMAANVSSIPLGQYVGNRLGNSPGGKVLPMMQSTRSLRGVGAYVSGAAREAQVR